MTRTARLAAGIVATAAGVLLLAWQVHVVGVRTIATGFAAVGWPWFLVILALAGLRYAVRAVAWVVLMRGGVPIATAIQATIAGDAVGTLTPLRLLASEPAKAVLLRDHVDTPRALAALVAENVFYSLSVAVVVIAGTGAMLAEYVLPPDLRMRGWAAVALMSAAIAGLAWLLWQRPALTSRIVRLAPGARSASILARIQAFETATYGFVHGHGLRLLIVVACEALFHVLSITETFVTLHALLPSTTILAAFVLDSVNRVINVVFMAIPLRAGVAEAGTRLVAVAIGIPAATGVTLPLVAKGRMLVWAAIGTMLLGSRTMRRRGRADART